MMHPHLDLMSEPLVSKQSEGLDTKIISSVMNADTDILDSIPAALIVTGLDRRITLFNPAAETLTGHSQSEVTGRRITDFIYCSSKEICPLCMDANAFGEVLNTRTTGRLNHAGIMFIRGRQEPRRPVHCKIAPVIGRADEINGLVLVIQPATNEIVSPRAYDLFALLAHQVRTYMTYVGVAAEGLHGGYSHFASQQEGLQFICDQIGHSTEVLEQGLKLIRVLREDSLHLEVVALSALVHTVIERLKSRYRERQIILSLPEKDCVFGNRLLIELVLENLLQNALTHAGTSNSVAVTAEAEAGMMIVSVADNGRGMPDQQLQSLFRPTKQGDSSSATQSSRGLGLFLTRLAVEIQGGQIWAESQLSAGSRFYFSLCKCDDLF